MNSDRQITFTKKRSPILPVTRTVLSDLKERVRKQIESKRVTGAKGGVR